MKYVAEFRDPGLVRRLADRLASTATRPWTVMEICGGQTHTIARYGLTDLLPSTIELVHGPGCPVCVTPLAILEAARQLALTDGVVLCTFGDMLRVPGASGDLLDARAHGGRVQIVTSPLDAVARAQRDPDHTYVFFAVGFETTAPAAAMAVELARRLDLHNFAILASHVRVPPAIEHILGSEGNRVQGFLAAGHVCTVEGTREYEPLVERFGVPIVITGFEPVDILRGLCACVRQLEQGRAELENEYARAVRAEGNLEAKRMVERVFEIVDRPWRGLGVLSASGLALRSTHARFDAARRFDLALAALEEPEACRAGLVLQGRLAPSQCPEFGRGCTPDHPLGAPLVSSEGACAAYFRFRRARGVEASETA
jgi:hydrogenase expression/formation protein HypD